MFVRFRHVRHRLIANLVETRRVGGKVRSEHIARLGSVALPEPIAVRERICFWRDLEERLRGLANRVSADDRRKALDSIRPRVPEPTEAEGQAVQIETARFDIAFWGKVRDGSADAEMIKVRRRMIEGIEKDLAEDRAQAEAAERRIAAAQARLVKLTRGEQVVGDDGPSAREAVLSVLRKARGLAD